ncbi:ABC transporter substrate-binding protein [Asanoa sp. WMMD1127]|uniref:ABC transporter substrate-binding protein n=1 Tax=Asanoa sp. WMMD1127 TaxID=3016107 RepID=UPI002417FCA7|nr:ABC transporter substrate-binding protein [Asanoa sp. WMMD1127]MDG4822900.1 ABC transporter substrate-binding protein [Asanoa sp. WMMD1127]
MRPPRTLRRLTAATGAALLLAATLAACSKNTGESGEENQDVVERTGAISTDPKESQGPAPEVQGATKGGILKIIQQADMEHMDPQRTYVVNAMALQHLIVRNLTQFREDGKGKLTLVGDLAEDPGKDVNGDCKTWEYTLKKGVKYEDGTEVKASDVAYGIARSFEETIDGGPTYVQEWLADNPTYNEVYKGPYTSGNTNVPGLTVNGDYGLKFEFKNPHCDLPFALSMGTSVPVPPAKDTKLDYDKRIFSSGPYKIKEYVKDSKIVLERNENWDANTDPIRHNYLDGVEVEIGPDDAAQTERVIAGGADANAIAYDNVPQSLVSKVQGDPALKERTIDTPNLFVWYLAINNQKVTDINVRRAIGCALDKQGILLTQGGDAAGRLTNNLQADTTIGYTEIADPTGCGPTGNPEKAKEMLGGKKIKLAFMSRDTAFGQQTAPVLKDSLEKAGFEVVVSYIAQPNHNPTARTKDNPYDIYISNWGADWPSGASTIPVLYDGRKIGPQGNSNVSYFNADDVNSAIDAASALPAGEAGDDWANIEKTIVEKYYPVVPIYQSKTFLVMGDKVGGVFHSDSIGTTVYYNAHIKQ